MCLKAVFQNTVSLSLVGGTVGLYSWGFFTLKYIICISESLSFAVAPVESNGCSFPCALVYILLPHHAAIYATTALQQYASVVAPTKGRGKFVWCCV